ncbi:MAG: DUF938 domain-containing protein [Pseudomonadota bacterium]
MTNHIVQQADEADDGRRIAPAALRNTVPLIEALRARLPDDGRVLELASGTGQHVAAFAEAFPHLEWLPSDVDEGQRASIHVWRQTSGLPNIAEPLALDVAELWSVDAGSVQGVLTVNLLHLIPTPFVSRIFSEAHRVLSEAGRVIIYGPFLRGSEFVSDGDREFDASLRSRDPAIGYKSVEFVSDAAANNGFHLVATDHMPANNLLLTYAKADVDL